MRDQHGRSIDYLRISVTDRCNLRCLYCMPEQGICKRSHDEILSYEEICVIVAAAAELGVRRLRLTGGEALVRPGIVDLVRQLAAIPGITEISLTTNGQKLADLAEPLKEAGLRRVNVSLDTLDKRRYRELTRGGELQRSLDGLAAAEQAGLSPIKINTVLIGGTNDDEIATLVDWVRDRPWQLRFIELMPIGVCSTWDKSCFIPVKRVLEQRPDLKEIAYGGVAKIYQEPGALGTVGLIAPVSDRFCAHCNRLRLTADGRLKPCLHSGVEIPLRGLSGAALRETIVAAIDMKPEGYSRAEWGTGVARRNMNEIGG